jgi:hypothetical protein
LSRANSQELTKQADSTLHPSSVPTWLHQAPHVVIGGFSVMANGFLRATKDSDLLVPDGQETDEAILRFLDRIEAGRLRDGKVHPGPGPNA